MTKRIEGRAKTSGRTDDNMESLKKRFRIFESETLPVIEYYEKKNKVIRVKKGIMKILLMFFFFLRLMVIKISRVSVKKLKEKSKKFCNLKKKSFF